MDGEDRISIPASENGKTLKQKLCDIKTTSRISEKIALQKGIRNKGGEAPINWLLLKKDEDAIGYKKATASTQYKALES